MVAVFSTMQELGIPAPDFELPDVTEENRLVSLEEYDSQPILIMFICNHCPYVIHVMKELTMIANQAIKDGYGVLAVSSNDASNYPQDGPRPMAQLAADYGFEFPYLYDESQAVALDYRAACTPDFFVYDRNHRLQYRGQMDDARPGNSKAVTGADLVAALASVMQDQLPKEPHTPSMGCNIKWRAGNEPDYF